MILNDSKIHRDIKEEVRSLGDLIEGCLNEEGYQTKEEHTFTASKIVGIRDFKGVEYTATIMVMRRRKGRQTE